MKEFSLKTGDVFVHQETKGIYTFDGLIFSTKTNNAEVSYHNQEDESFTRDMGEFFGYTEKKKKRFLPIEEYLKNNEDVFLAKESNKENSDLYVLVCVVGINNKKYSACYRIQDNKTILINRYENKNNQVELQYIEDDEEFDIACKNIRAEIDQFDSIFEYSILR